ncbi:hypothetical protein SY83_08865 [Paenibacillus swuensis]|uniref:Uncharacterized protein n=1 Tax=Paenibacillus swuensis TaxID=1178515 RepID=A0A172THD1_9BACL|nr:hypothetical protein [Paenibacillus swuensis]ANE46372.1 hypothetical protein SY83_08865 [Paenibacillus swuensis]
MTKIVPIEYNQQVQYITLGRIIKMIHLGSKKYYILYGFFLAATVFSFFVIHRGYSDDHPFALFAIYFLISLVILGLILIVVVLYGLRKLTLAQLRSRMILFLAVYMVSTLLHFVFYREWSFTSALGVSFLVAFITPALWNIMENDKEEG